MPQIITKIPHQDKWPELEAPKISSISQLALHLSQFYPPQQQEDAHQKIENSLEKVAAYCRTNPNSANAFQTYVHTLLELVKKSNEMNDAHGASRVEFAKLVTSPTKLIEQCTVYSEQVMNRLKGFFTEAKIGLALVRSGLTVLDTSTRIYRGEFLTSSSETGAQPIEREIDFICRHPASETPIFVECKSQPSTFVSTNLRNNPQIIAFQQIANKFKAHTLIVFGESRGWTKIRAEIDQILNFCRTSCGGKAPRMLSADDGVLGQLSAYSAAKSITR